MSKKKEILFGAAAWLLLGWLVDMLKPTPAELPDDISDFKARAFDAFTLQRYLSKVSVMDSGQISTILTGTRTNADVECRQALRRFGEQCIVMADTGEIPGREV